MYFQDSVMDCRFESDNCISEPTVDNDKRMSLTINPYDYYNNRFSEGQNVQHSAKQTKSTAKELEEKANFLQEKTTMDQNLLEDGLNHYKRAECFFTGNGFQNGHYTACIPLNVDGSISLIPSENNGVNQGYTKFGVVSKSDLTRESPLKTKSQNGMSDYNSSKQQIDEEAIVDLAANKYNRWNRTIHDYLWCPFVIFFVFFCCAPAILLMHKSDVAFRKGRDSEARRCAMCSSLLYGIGLVFTLAFYAMIFALVIIFAKYELF